ncbi:hypothetical protein TIFTF001_031995 [Ficus carica]|uniref:Uncharacterized protein n=1 Tax=Ficus carica TaxID=3494 RepID=A0AA88J1U1_FICCA|nr:hypothetical protein TIFTF001_031995 [Ficus carica]
MMANGELLILHCMVKLQATKPLPSFPFYRQGSGSSGDILEQAMSRFASNT